MFAPFSLLYGNSILFPFLFFIHLFLSPKKQTRWKLHKKTEKDKARVAPSVFASLSLSLSLLF